MMCDVSNMRHNLPVDDVGMLIILLFPVAVFVVLWKVFSTRAFPWRALFSRVAVGIATYEFGVFVYEINSTIQEWLSLLNGGIS